MKRWWIGSCIALILLLGSCSADLTGQASADQPIEKVTITKTSFDPLVLNIKAGTKVIWTNKDNESHTITILGLFDSGTIGRRNTFSFTFLEPGSYTYTDLFNQDLKGKVVVR